MELIHKVWARARRLDHMSIRHKLGVLFIAFFLLVTTSVVATYLALTRQQEDALVVNLAGRQRMLIQAMTRYALEMERHPDHGALSEQLRTVIATFDTTLTALSEGGPAPYTEGRTVVLPPPPTADVQAKLHRVRALWETFRLELDVILREPSINSAAFREAVSDVERQSPVLVAAMDEAVRAFEHAAQAKVRQVIFMQLLFLSAAAVLVGVGYTLTHRRIILPIQYLEQVAQTIGRGQLDTPVARTGHDEIGRLAESLEEMRRQLRAAREDLEAQVAQRTRELEALYEVTRDISSHLDVRRVLRSVTEKARELLDADVAVLCMLDGSGQTLRLQAVAGDTKSIRQRDEASHKPLVATILHRKDAINCTVCPGWCHILDSRYQADHLAAPLRAGNRIIGALCVGSREPNRFPAEALGLLTRLANSAAIALENARLYEQAERVAALEERQRIAADMHDSVAQTLSYLALKVEQIAEEVAAGAGKDAVEDLERLREHIDHTLEDVRRIIADLQRPVAARLSLQDALRHVVQEVAKQSPYPIRLDVSTDEPVYLSPEVAEQVLRVTREAVVNAIRHASPTAIHVRFWTEAAKGVIQVADDGRGFDVEAASRDGQRHFGLKIMQARAARIGGHLVIETRPGAGTRVQLIFPLGGTEGRP